MSPVRRAAVAALAALLVALPSVASASSPPAHDPAAAVDHILVEVDPAHAGGVGVAAATGPSWHAVPVPAGAGLDATLERWRRQPGVLAAQPDYRYRAAALSAIAFPPDDPYFPQQWNLPDVTVPDAWATSTGAGEIVAVVDTGIATGGQDLTCHTLVSAYNALTQTSGTGVADDDDGHGTHVAGTVAECTDNGVGAAGVAPDAVLMPVKVLDRLGTGSSSAVAAGIDWARTHGARVINLSLAAASNCGEGCDLVVDQAIARAVSANIVVVAAAGNDPSHVAYPASNHEVLAVGATTRDRSVASYSGRGSGLAVVAPGGDISVSETGGILQETFDVTKGGTKSWGYFWEAGTSMAAAHVSGIAALYRAAYPLASGWQVAHALESTALDLGASGFDSVSGWGLVQAAAALAVRPAWRYFGADRYATAAAVSRTDFPSGASTVFVATGADYPDALSGAAVAGTLGAPVLLTRRDSLPGVTRTEIARLKPDTIVVLGGTAAVSAAVETELGGLAAHVSRLAGADRYDTAALVSAFGYPKGAPVAFVATGAGFADALSGGPAAAALGGPILLTAPAKVPGPTLRELQRLGVSKIVVLGGPAAVSDQVAAELATVAPVERVSGPDRFATAAAASQMAFPTGANRVYVATGLDFPDALAGGAAAGAKGGPVLLVRTGDIPPATRSELVRLQPHEIVVLGGPGAVSPDVEIALDAYLH